MKTFEIFFVMYT